MDHPSYVKHVSARIYVFFYPIWELGVGRVSTKGFVHKLLWQFFAPGSSKIEVSDFYIMTTHNDHPSYVMYALGSICVFFTSIGCVCHLGVHCSRYILCEGLAEGNKVE